MGAPRRLAYLWHLRRDRSDATEVEIQFLPAGAFTRVRSSMPAGIASAPMRQEWRDRNQAGWDTLLPHYQRHEQTARDGSEQTASEQTA